MSTDDSTVVDGTGRQQEANDAPKILLQIRLIAPTKWLSHGYPLWRLPAAPYIIETGQHMDMRHFSGTAVRAINSGTDGRHIRALRRGLQHQCLMFVVDDTHPILD